VDRQAPEIITGQDYDERVDLFSFGIVLCEIITRRKISRELQRKPEEAFALNPNELFKLIPRDCPEALKQLALKCADYTPENRPSFLKVLDSLAEIDKELREGTLQTSGGIKLAPEPSTPKPEIWAPAVYVSCVRAVVCGDACAVVWRKTYCVSGVWRGSGAVPSGSTSEATRGTRAPRSRRPSSRWPPRPSSPPSRGARRTHTTSSLHASANASTWLCNAMI